MKEKNKIVALGVLIMVCLSTFIRWYVFRIDARTNLILAGISVIIITSTILFFRRLYAYFDERLPYDGQIIKRLLLQYFITLVFISLATRFIVFLATNIVGSDNLVNTELTHLAKIAAYAAQILLVTLLNLAHFTYYSLQKWRENALRATNLEKEKSQVQFDNLKNQLNPHFLFNSLTSLDSLIQENPALARDFLQQLSKVFRYVLKHKEKGLVSLETELLFIKNYVALVQTRFGSSLKVNFNIKEDALDSQIAPVALQILIENAIKHNTVNEKNPLTISITSEEGYLIVKNNIQKKRQVETSNGQGLSNLKSLYSFLSQSSIEIIEEADVFIVKIPLI